MSEWVRRMQELQANAKPGARPVALTAEKLDRTLGDAVRRVTAAPTSANHVAAGVAYYNAGILDSAQDHLAEALRLDSSDAAAYDLRARIWRDWGVPAAALGDAYRAVYYAPESAEARNTLGTVFLALGNVGAARSAYGEATRLDVGAAYAWSNLCYVSALEGDIAIGEQACRRALTIEPSLTPARRNLERLHGLAAGAAAPGEGTR